MIKFFVAYDDLDPKLGRYFSECFTYLKDYVEQHLPDAEFEGIDQLRCNYAYLDLRISEAISLEKRFIFVAYSHGNAHGVCTTQNYIKINDNTHLFSNSFFYSIACGDGEDFARDLISNGCTTFIGYKSITFVTLIHLDIFLKCDNTKSILH